MHFQQFTTRKEFMGKWDSNKLVVCSVMVKPIRVIFFDKLRTWVDQIVRVPVHTFVVEESKIPLNPENIDGYWYCAGDFCDVSDAGVYQDIGEANIDYAKCLVAPNIKDDDPLRPAMVIHGRYGVNYVCHNITNRILYATSDKKTLSQINILKTGYSTVVKSVLGIYGQNKVEWERRKKVCGSNFDDDLELNMGMSHKFRDEAQLNEIERIHLEAAQGDLEKAQNLTLALNDVDVEFFISTGEIVQKYMNGLVDYEKFNTLMVGACAVLFNKTVNKIGREMTLRIYPDCLIDLDFEKKHEPPEEDMVALG